MITCLWCHGEKRHRDRSGRFARGRRGKCPDAHRLDKETEHERWIAERVDLKLHGKVQRRPCWCRVCSVRRYRARRVAMARQANHRKAQ